MSKPKLPNLPIYWQDFNRRNEIKLDVATTQLLVNGQTTYIQRVIDGEKRRVTLDKYFLEYYLENTIGCFLPKFGATHAQFNFLKTWIEANYE